LKRSIPLDLGPVPAYGGDFSYHAFS
jgi:hypothetical protein